MAATGHALAHAPQSMHFWESCSTRTSRSLLAITGQTPVHVLQ
jgi:hypothetical protein